jgi:large subunit ribosomal protein L24
MKTETPYRRLHVRRGDIVAAINGEDAVEGKTGKVLRVMPNAGKAVVEGFNFVKRHMRKNQDNPKGGIVEKEAPMDVSKLRVVEAASGKGEGETKRKG